MPRLWNYYWITLTAFAVFTRGPKFKRRCTVQAEQVRNEMVCQFGSYMQSNKLRNTL